MIDNKWNHEKVKLDLSLLPSVLLELSGIKPVSFILDQNIGSEIVLLITEPREQIEEFKSLDITSFFMRSGLVNTSYGPVYWLLFFFRFPETDQRITYENIINPHEKQQVAIYRQLAEQKYWHVVIADERGNILNFFEFPNKYELSDTLEEVQQVCSKLLVSDFVAARAEYEATYSIEELLEL